MEALRLTFRPNFGDASHGILYGFWGTPRRALVSLAMGLVFGAAMAYAIAGATAPLRVVLVAAAIGAIAFSVLFTFGFGAAMAAYLVNLQRRKGDHAIVLTGEGVERSAGGMVVKLPWTEVSRVVETRRAFLLYDTSRPTLSIEKSAAPSLRALHELRAFLRARKPGSDLPGS